MRALSAGLCVATLALASAGAIADTSYTKLDLKHGISIEIPSHWKVLSQARNSNIEAAAEGVVRGAGVGPRDGKNEVILGAIATPDPSGASIRINVMTQVPVTEAQLMALTEQELANLRLQMLATFKKMEASGGPKVIEMAPFYRERVGGSMALVMPYRRADALGSWQVIQYKIATPTRLIELTMSYRESGSIMWKPILEYAKKSIRF